MGPRADRPNGVLTVIPARFAVVLTVALATSGCALAIDPPPSVDVLDVRLVGFGLEEQQLATTLCVTNRSASTLAFRRVSVVLDVSGSPLAAGTSELPVSLAPLSSTPVSFTVVTTVRNLGPQLLDILRSGSLDYRVHGSVAPNGAFGLALPYSRSGRLDLLAGGFELASAASDPSPSPCAAGAAVPPRT